jgi:hypothetical protein
MAREEQPRQGRGFVAGLIIGLLAAAVVGLTLYIVLDEPNDPAAASDKQTTASPTPSPTPSATPSPSPRPDAQVSEPFNDPLSWAEGERLSFADFWLPNHSNDCRTHTFRYHGKTHGAFRSDCASWEPEYDILLFSVGLQNTTARPVRFNLRHFVLVTRDFRSFGPVNVRSHAEFPPNFLPERTIIAPRSVLRGYLTFDGRVSGVVPDRLSYVDGDQTLTQTFEGRHAVTFP